MGPQGARLGPPPALVCSVARKEVCELSPQTEELGGWGRSEKHSASHPPFPPSPYPQSTIQEMGRAGPASCKRKAGGSNHRQTQAVSHEDALLKQTQRQHKAWVVALQAESSWG